MDRRELLEGLIFLMFGPRKKPAATMVAAAAVPVKLADGGRVRYALAEHRAGEWKLYAVAADGGVQLEDQVAEIRVTAIRDVQAP